MKQICFVSVLALTTKTSELEESVFSVATRGDCVDNDDVEENSGWLCP